MADNKNAQTRTSTNKMLIDATHPEETRVVVLRKNRVEEFDYESAARKLLRGNIYLAKVTRVEPSLQAAFVDYGGNRHGFLAFNEIHPDYYQIPIADRRALIEAEAAEEAEAAAIDDAEADAEVVNTHDEDTQDADTPKTDGDTELDEYAAIDVTGVMPSDTGDAPETHQPQDESTEEAVSANDAIDYVAPERLSGYDPVLSHTTFTETSEQIGTVPVNENTGADDQPLPDTSEAPATIGLIEDQSVSDAEGEENGNDEAVEEVASTGNDDALEELPARQRRRQRSYKIQEVIKRKQVILTQVAKEERGTKGAALTTYLSLAGRYTVLMPNTARGGGISRKITTPQDRKRLKAIAEDLDVPEGMGLIIRTAGASRTKQEIRRDFEYLLRLWENVRELTLQSTAPALVYEEGNLVKRSIRDLYGKEVDEIVVAGEAAYREAKDFMRMLMPSHVKNVTNYSASEPLFTSYQIERQLNAMFSPYVHLKSGGYLVINQTEALVAVDVNSGKSTREFSIEETAFNTNLEAADELARQLKLRDLAGLIVVDFIDMEEKRNNRTVERRIKEALRDDRARIQVGHISHFGLLEMSRQRMRTGVLEGSTTQCPHCQGTGIIRSTESVALSVLRALEDALTNNRPSPLTANSTATVALYLLNNKRHFINEMEQRYGFPVTVLASDKLEGSDFTIEQAPTTRSADKQTPSSAVSMDWSYKGEEAGTDDKDGDSDSKDGEKNRRGGRRRRRRGKRDENGADRADTRSTQDADAENATDTAALDEAAEGDVNNDRQAAQSETAEGEGTRTRRRGRRGGRRNRRGPQNETANQTNEAAADGEQPGTEQATADNDTGMQNGAGAFATASMSGETATENGIDPNPEPFAASEVHGGAANSNTYDAEPEPVVAEPEAPAHADTSPADEPYIQVVPAEPAEPVLERVIVNPDQPDNSTPAAEEDNNGPAKRGWWQRRILGE